MFKGHPPAWARVMVTITCKWLTLRVPHIISVFVLPRHCSCAIFGVISPKSRLSQSITNELFRCVLANRRNFKALKVQHCLPKMYSSTLLYSSHLDSGSGTRSATVTLTRISRRIHIHSRPKHKHASDSCEECYRDKRDVRQLSPIQKVPNRFRGI